MATLCRVEYLSPKGWFLAHHGANFINPSLYVCSLAENAGVLARLTELDDKLQPSGEVHYSPRLAELEEVL